MFHRVATLRNRHVPTAIRTLGRTALAAPPWSRARRLLVGDCERAVAEGHFKPVHCRIVQDTAAASGASRVFGRTATDAWSFAHAAHCLHSVDNQIEEY